jgi:hypothetical protein
MGDEVIAVAITHLDKVAVFVVDALDGFLRGLEVERPRVPHHHPCQICPQLLAFWNHGFDLISGLEAMDRFGAHEVTSREAILGKPGPRWYAPRPYAVMSLLCVMLGSLPVCMLMLHFAQQKSLSMVLAAAIAGEIMPIAECYFVFALKDVWSEFAPKVRLRPKLA